ncbi:MAG: HIT domain-containing protein [Bacteroidota bacterium]
MEIMWASWRSKYIQGFKDETECGDSTCIFCSAAGNPENDSELYVVARRKNCFVMLNRFPYNGGHLMVAPYRHVAELDGLTLEEMTEIMIVIKESTKALCKISKPHGYNIGSNIGRVAGAGIPGHIHFHIVPRWNGDTNFMSVISDTKVVSQSLEETQVLLTKAFAELEHGNQ